MKILVLGSSCNYNLEYFTTENLGKLGPEVRFSGYSSSLRRLAVPTRLLITRSNAFDALAQTFLLAKYNSRLTKLCKEFRPDAIVVIKGEALNPKVMTKIKNEIGARLVLWYPDDPRYRGTIIKRIIHCFDYVFTVSPKAVDEYKEMGVRNVSYLPVACDPTFHKSLKLSDSEMKRYSNDVIFVGTYYPRRARFVKALKKAGIKVGIYGDYWNYFWSGKGANRPISGPEMVKAFNASKIVLNVHADSDVDNKVNTRTFEATGCGSFLLTDRSYGMDKCFKIGEEVECYDDERDLVELTKYYLNADKERKEISERGQERAYHDHTYGSRLTEMLEIIRA